MPTAITPLANITLGSSQASVTFSSISGSYRDLRLVIQTTSASSEILVMTVNSDTGTNYPSVWMGGNGSSAYSSSSTTFTYHQLGANLISDTTVHDFSTTDIMDYSATDKHKTIVTRANDSVNAVEAICTRWASTSAITSLQIKGKYSVNFTAGSTFALYGVSS